MSGHPSAAGRALDRESSPVTDRRSTTLGGRGEWKPPRQFPRQATVWTDTTDLSEELFDELFSPAEMKVPCLGGVRDVSRVHYESQRLRLINAAETHSAPQSLFAP